MKLFKYNQKKSDINGLKFIPDLIEYKNSDDWIPEAYIDGVLTNIHDKHNKITQEFSENNKQVLKSLIDDLEQKNKLNTILEIGVNRSGNYSSTEFILKNKLKHTKYIGIDVQQYLIDTVYNENLNNFGLATDSSNYQIIVNYLNSLNIEKIDLFIIDGWHSVDQVVKDWKFTNLLNVGGHVLMHDTNYHPGPYCVYEAIDTEYFTKEKYFTNLEYDWGVTTATKIKEYIL